VPIASTFNTALKIEDQLNEINISQDLPPVNVINPSQNAVWVGHRDVNTTIFDGYFDNGGNIQKNDNIYHKYSWKSVNKAAKTITLQRFNVNAHENPDRLQKFLVPVYTLWHEAKDCNLCYPNNSYEKQAKHR
jgi:hypothetical protein